MLHVSKRKAAWMLQNGIIPCRMRNTKTHRYAVRIEDVEAYLKKTSKERRKEIPVGEFNVKPWLVDFLAGDTAFEIVNKSNWHMNTILKFKKNR